MVKLIGKNNPMWGKDPWNKGKHTGNFGNGFKKGNVPWNAGKKGVYSREYIEKLRRARIGKVISKKTKKKISESLRGEKHPLYGKHLSERTKQKMSETRKKLWKKGKLNVVNGMKGKHHTEKAKKMISDAHKKSGLKPPVMKGKECHLWKGGISFAPYPLEWTRELKRFIRKRDNYICRICGKKPAVYIHHIDYNKENCNPNNLITLCHNCHSKTNHKRPEWVGYFNQINFLNKNLWHNNTK